MRAWDVFCSPNASARLLTDLVECAAERAHHVAAAEEKQLLTPMVVPLEGALHVTCGANHGDRRRLCPGDVYRRGGRDEPLLVRSASGTAATFLDEGLLAEFLDLFQAAHTLRPEARGLLRPENVPPAAHSVWLCGNVPAPAEPLAFAHLLAGAIAEQFDEAAAIVTLTEGGPAEVAVCLGDVFLDCGTLPQAPTDTAVVAFLNRRLRPAAPSFYHLVYVHAPAPNALPASVQRQRFDRIVHLGTSLPPGIPGPLERFLKDAARNPTSPSDPYFTSFVPSIVSPNGRLARRCARPGGFDRFVQDPAERPRDWRIVRDACWLDLDLRAVAEAWAAWKERRRAPFVSALQAARPGVRPTLDRWARATTNRQVGVALSGGGASSYRFVPVLSRFSAPGGDAREALPVDVVSGVSGGALLGAYYCARGAAGLDQALGEGWRFQSALLGFALSGTLLQSIVKLGLGRGSIADFPTRFVPVAVGLPRGGRPPDTRVILDWSVAEAVHASGSLPGVFAPSWIHGERFADGAFGTVIPAQVVKDYGADLVIGLNCIAGPAIGSPFEDSALVELARTWTPVVRRFVDLWVSIAYLLQESSRLIGQVPYVHELVEPSSTGAPFVEFAKFAWAPAIAKEAGEDAKFMDGAQRCLDRWREFKRWGPSASALATELDQVEPQSEGGAMVQAEGIAGLLSDAQLVALIRGYRPDLVVDMLENQTPRNYKPAQPYFTAVVETFFRDVSKLPGEIRPALNVPDRQRCILALQAGTGQTITLAIHTYISLMEGITVNEIANILLLAGVYTGVPNFFTGLNVLSETLQLLGALADQGTVDPKSVVGALQAEFGAGRPGPGPGAAAPAPGPATQRARGQRMI